MLVLGSEGAGVRPLVRERCDAAISIPMHGQVGSLNVAVAAAILLYEAQRQRRAAHSLRTISRAGTGAGPSQRLGQAPPHSPRSSSL